MNDYLANQENFTAAMGDAASSIVEYFRNKSGIAFINVMQIFLCYVIALELMLLYRI